MIALPLMMEAPEKLEKSICNGRSQLLLLEPSPVIMSTDPLQALVLSQKLTHLKLMKGLSVKILSITKMFQV